MPADKGAKVSLVVGSGGQDGYYLTELLRARGDHVVGITRTACTSSRRGALAAVDILAREQVARLLAEIRPAEVYYLAASHHSAEAAAKDPYETFRRANDVHVGGLLNFLDGMERHAKAARLFFAASSHVFGQAATSPQSELTPLAPICAYGVTKTAGIGLCRFYRISRGVFASAGILYNHESPRRTASFVSRKIVQAAVDIQLGAKRVLTLGDLSAQVDWGAAEDYVEAMTRILKLEEPGDYVVASGLLHTVREFVEAAFSALSMAWQPHVVEDGSLLKNVRPALVGDATRLRETTGWRPTLDFTEMVRRMVGAEMKTRKAALS